VKDFRGRALDQSNVKITLDGDQDIGKFHYFLSLFRLDEALQPSKPENLEKIKLGFLFRFFHPLEAYKLQRDVSFTDLSPDQMKEKIIALAPQMAKHFHEYNIQPVEVLPGLVRYSIPIERQVYGLGGRALTAMISGDRVIMSPLDERELCAISNIVKHGMLSEHLRKAGKIDELGLTGNGSVFTQMIWKQDVKGKKNIADLGYCYGGNIRLYFSLKALNRGSHQYNSHLDKYNSNFFGTHEGTAYEGRKNILDFIQFFPFWNVIAQQNHELMLPDRILPGEIQGMSVTTEQIREQVLNHFRKVQMIQVDAQGCETINGIIAKDFISVEHHVPADIVKRCSSDSVV
jgi:hypothetical protein